MKRLFTLNKVLFLLLTVTPLFGQVQTTTSITGIVRDSTGAVIPGVDVTVRDQGTGAVRQTITNDAGYYVVPSLRPGTYTVTAAMSGFRTSVVTDREAQVAIPAQVNITLQIGEMEDTVTVSASGAELLNTTTAELAATIDQNLVESLPNQTRNFFDLLALAPNTSPQYLSMGLMSYGQHSIRRVTAANSFESSGVFAGGQVDSSSNISIDGANSMNVMYQMQVTILSSSAIKELRLQTASANAEFGYGTNAVNVITKSGSNDVHGEAFWQHRNDNLDATDFFVNLAGNVLPEYKRNKFGASLGGPILQDRLHFFANFEGSRLIQHSPGTALVAPADVRGGDFSTAVLPGPDGTTVPMRTIFNPYDFDPVTGLRRPFPGNRIPPDMLDPAIQKFLEFTFLPNIVIDGVPRFSGVTTTTVDENQYTGRFDFQASDVSTIWGRHTWAERKAVSGGLISPLQGDATPASERTFVVNWTRLFGATMVNDFHVSYSRPTWGIGRVTDVPDVAALMGLRNTSIYTGSPSISAGDYSLGSSATGYRDPTQNTYQIKNDVSRTWGNHTFKAGFHVTERRYLYRLQFTDKGTMSFDDTYTRACPLGNAVCEAARLEAGVEEGGQAMADFLLGTLNQANIEIRPVDWHGHERYYGTYFQDTWQLHPRLSVNLGLRHEYWGPWRLPRHNSVRFEPVGEGRLIYSLANPLDAFDPSPEKRHGRSAELNPEAHPHGYVRDKLSFAPRLGFAFTVTPNTVIRAAGGIFYAGNINANRASDMQGGAAPFTLTSYQRTTRNEQLPPLLARNQYPESLAEAIPTPYEDPPRAGRLFAMEGGKLPTPKVYQWSFGFQHRLSPQWSVNFDYMGTRTTHNAQFVDRNAPALPVGDLADVPLQQRRPMPGWGVVSSWVSWATQNYNSATFGVQNRDWRGLSLLSNFTWAKNLSTNRGDAENYIGNYHYAYYDMWRGRSSLTPTARFVNSFSYRLPVGHGRQHALGGIADAILGGWSLSGIAEFSTGSPRTVTYTDTSGTGVGSQFANRLADCDINDAPGDRFEYFNVACFSPPPYGTWGNSPAGIINAPGIHNWNMALAKSFRLYEEHELEFRMETFNTFNRTQWGNITTALNSASFGRVSGTRPARQLQVSLFYKF